MDTGPFAGAEILVGYRGSLKFVFRRGQASFAPNSASVTPATAYGLASLSKLVGTASAAMLAVDSGILLPKALVRDYLPEFAGETLRVQELLTSMNVESRAGLVDEIVSRASGTSIGKFLTKELFEPLGINCIPSGKTQQPAEIQLYCRGRELAVFAQMLLNKGMYDHRRFFRPATVAKYMGPGGPWSKLAAAEWTRGLFSASAFGHCSAAGPALWIDPDRQLFVVLLTSAAKGRVEEAQRAIIKSVVSPITNNHETY